MSFFKKLFGDKENSQDDHHKLDLDSLLSSTDTNSSVIEFDNYICKLCSWGDNLERLTQPQKNFFFNQNLEREINNGGFNQYFYNSSGDYAQETLTSLQAIGANKTADILRQAIDQFPSSTVPKDRQERQNLLEQIEANANEVWEQLDQMFYVYEDNLNELNLQYVKQHRNSFKWRQGNLQHGVLCKLGTTLLHQLSANIGCRFGWTNNAKQQNKQWTLIYKLSSGYGQTEC